MVFQPNMDVSAVINKRATYPQRADSSQTKTLTMKKFTIIPSPFLHGDGRTT